MYLFIYIEFIVYVCKSFLFQESLSVIKCKWECFTASGHAVDVPCFFFPVIFVVTFGVCRRQAEKHLKACRRGQKILSRMDVERTQNI